PPAHEPVGGHRPPHGGPSCRGRRVTASGRAGPGPALATALQATVKRAASAPGHKCLDTRRTCWRTPRMRLGVSLAQTGRLADPASVRSAATAAEQVGYASVWVHDRLDGGRAGDASLDPLCALSYAAAVTSRVRLGTSVLVAPWYRPALLARSLASLDVLSDGRLTIGLGLDATPAELAAVGVDDAELGRRLDDALDVIGRTWDPGPEEHPARPRPPVPLAASTPRGPHRAAAGRARRPAHHRPAAGGRPPRLRRHRRAGGRGRRGHRPGRRPRDDPLPAGRPRAGHRARRVRPDRRGRRRHPATAAGRGRSGACRRSPRPPGAPARPAPRARAPGGGALPPAAGGAAGSAGPHPDPRRGPPGPRRPPPGARVARGPGTTVRPPAPTKAATASSSRGRPAATTPSSTRAAARKACRPRPQNVKRDSGSASTPRRAARSAQAGSPTSSAAAAASISTMGMA